MRRDSLDSSVFEPSCPADAENLQGSALVERAVSVLDCFPGRAKDSDGRPGGLVEIPPGIRPIIVGDLHANRENLAAIVDHGTNISDLEGGKAVCVILGDAVHDDQTGFMRTMDSSVEILEDLFRLIVRFPGRVCYIRGNHDTFDDRLRKSGIAQGAELRKALVLALGGGYADAVGKFFESLPVFVIGAGYVITHAGPPRGGLVREEIVDIRRYPEKYHQL
ncbi:MAG TPA: metallophosphoesterase, partial [Magnetospirillaceae bacterium]|nr:metallophosphoesterase [Magnetospirillaceae bacterium]